MPSKSNKKRSKLRPNLKKAHTLYSWQNADLKTNFYLEIFILSLVVIFSSNIFIYFSLVILHYFYELLTYINDHSTNNKKNTHQNFQFYSPDFVVYRSYLKSAWKINEISVHFTTYKFLESIIYNLKQIQSNQRIKTNTNNHIQTKQYKVIFSESTKKINS